MWIRGKAMVKTGHWSISVLMGHNNDKPGEKLKENKRGAIVGS
jgi:hypothetical protein